MDSPSGSASQGTSAGVPCGSSAPTAAAPARVLLPSTPSHRTRTTPPRACGARTSRSPRTRASAPGGRTAGCRARSRTARTSPGTPSLRQLKRLKRGRQPRLQRIQEACRACCCGLRSHLKHVPAGDRVSSGEVLKGQPGQRRDIPMQLGEVGHFRLWPGFKSAANECRRPVMITHQQTLASLLG